MKHLILGINIALALFTVTVSYSANAGVRQDVEANTQAIAELQGDQVQTRNGIVNNSRDIDTLYEAATLTARAITGVHTDSLSRDYSIERKVDSTIDFVKQQQAYIESEFNYVHGYLANTTAIAGLTDDHISVAVGGHYGYTSIAIGSTFSAGDFTFKLTGAFNSDTEEASGSFGIGYSF